MKMKHVPEASDIPSFADAVGVGGGGGVEHQLDVVAQASGFSEKEAKDLDAFVATEGWGGDDVDGSDGDEEQEPEEGGSDAGDGDESGEEVESDGEKCESDDEDGEGEDCGGKEGDGKGRIRCVKAPESVTKRAHAAVQRQRRAAGAGRGAKSRNHQKRKEKGKMLYKHRDF